MSNLNCWLKSQTKCTFIDLILGFELKVKWVFPQSSLQLICCILIFKVLSVSLHSLIWCCFCFCVAIGAVFPTEFEFIWFLWLHFVSVSPNIIFFPFQRILCLIQTLNVPSHSFDRIDYDFADVFFISSLFIFCGSSPFCVPFIFSDIGHWVVSSNSHCGTERRKKKIKQIYFASLNSLKMWAKEKQTDTDKSEMQMIRKSLFASSTISYRYAAYCLWWWWWWKWRYFLGRIDLLRNKYPVA